MVGDVIHLYNHVELKVNDIICDYFQPTYEKSFFKEIVLNNMIIGMGSKIKILTNLKKFDEKIVQKIRNLNNIRNALAHNNSGGHVDLKLMKASIKISYLHSSGKVKCEELEILCNQFRDTYDEVIFRLNEYHEKNKN